MGVNNNRKLKINDEAYCEIVRVISHLQLQNGGKRVTTSQAILEMAKAYQTLNATDELDNRKI